MQTEYKSVNYAKKSFLTSSVDMSGFETMLNEQADKGWELVTVSPYGFGNWVSVIAVFKREKQAIRMTG